jgi:choline dehydrogenase
MYRPDVASGASFDYVIVGAGSAGCVLANRLSADGRHSVLLLEAGGKDSNLNIHIPLLVANILRDERLTWPLLTEPQGFLKGQRQLWVQGKVIGGSSSINGNLYVRGDPREYDGWAAQGCHGWGYADLLPYFMKLEDYPDGDMRVRGRGGPIGCTQLRDFDPLSNAFIQACEQAGSPLRADYNDGSSYEGTFYSQYSTRRGLRSSSAVGYLRPAQRRRNLTVVTNMLATRVLFEGKRATGVEFIIGGKSAGEKRRVVALREVILCAGALHTPKLLELSGIGDATTLQRCGVGVVHHLPGVGENLRDHTATRLTFECNKPITINDVARSPWLKFKEGLRFALRREGLLTISSSTAQTNLRASPGSARADLLLRLQPFSGKDRYARTPKLGMDAFPGFTISIGILNPRSVGSMHVNCADPHTQASMDPRYLSDEHDTAMYLRGLRIARKVASQPALQELVVRETRPGPAVDDDAAVMDYIKSTVQTSWHMVGTCRMGTEGDRMAVVDSRLNVRGMCGLRVVDASIFPTIPSSNTNIPTIAAAEKASDLILAASALR